MKRTIMRTIPTLLPKFAIALILALLFTSTAAFSGEKPHPEQEPDAQDHTSSADYNVKFKPAAAADRFGTNKSHQRRQPWADRAEVGKAVFDNSHETRSPNQSPSCFPTGKVGTAEPGTPWHSGSPISTRPRMPTEKIGPTLIYKRCKTKKVRRTRVEQSSGGVSSGTATSIVGDNPGQAGGTFGSAQGPSMVRCEQRMYERCRELPKLVGDKSFPDGCINYGEHGETKSKVAFPTIPGKIWPIVTQPYQPQGPEKMAAWAKVMDEITGYSQNPQIGEVNLSPAFCALALANQAQMLADTLQNPQENFPRVREEQNQQIQQSADNFAAIERQQAGCAIDFIASYLTNFTVDNGNKWNKLRNQLFLPIALLLVLPGAVLAQTKSIVSQGFPVLGDINPWDGILRSVIAIFLIPSTFLVVNYGIDLANSITFTISDQYEKLFGSDMYEDAMCAHIRAFPFREPAENKNFVPAEEAKMGKLSPNDTPFAHLEGQMIDVKLVDPCAGLNIVPADRANEQVPHSVNAQRNAYNQTNAALAMGWNILCAFQIAYLYYLWFVGPVVAALWVYPMKQLRDAFPSWCEGVLTLCFWSLFWNTVVLLMACFRGVDDTGTIIMTALNFLATACVKFAFDFAGLVKDAGREAARMAQKLTDSAQNSQAAQGRNAATQPNQMPTGQPQDQGGKPGDLQANPAAQLAANTLDGNGHNLSTVSTSPITGQVGDMLISGPPLSGDSHFGAGLVAGLAIGSVGLELANHLAVQPFVNQPSASLLSGNGSTSTGDGTSVNAQAEPANNIGAEGAGITGPGTSFDTFNGSLPNNAVSPFAGVVGDNGNLNTLGRHSGDFSDTPVPLSLTPVESNNPSPLAAPSTPNLGMMNLPAIEHAQGNNSPRGDGVLPNLGTSTINSSALPAGEGPASQLSQSENSNRGLVLPESWQSTLGDTSVMHRQPIGELSEKTNSGISGDQQGALIQLQDHYKGGYSLANQGFGVSTVRAADSGLDMNTNSSGNIVDLSVNGAVLCGSNEAGYTSPVSTVGTTRGNNNFTTALDWLGQNTHYSGSQNSPAADELIRSLTSNSDSSEKVENTTDTSISSTSSSGEYSKLSNNDDSAALYPQSTSSLSSASYCSSTAFHGPANSSKESYEGMPCDSQTVLPLTMAAIADTSGTDKLESANAWADNCPSVAQSSQLQYGPATNAPTETSHDRSLESSTAATARQEGQYLVQVANSAMSSSTFFKLSDSGNVSCAQTRQSPSFEQNGAQVSERSNRSLIRNTSNSQSESVASHSAALSRVPSRTDGILRSSAALIGTTAPSSGKMVLANRNQVHNPPSFPSVKQKEGGVANDPFNRKSMHNPLDIESGTTLRRYRQSRKLTPAQTYELERQARESRQDWLPC